MNNIISKRLMESSDAMRKSAEDNEILLSVEALAKTVLDVYRRGGKVLLAGNGGSAADAQHIAAELVARFYFDRPALKAEALTVNTSVITAIANDYDYDSVFSRQIEANGDEGDLFIAISTSGNSPNILKAVETAKNKGITTAALTGKDGGKMKGMCDISVVIKSDDTPRIQENHIAVAHIICEIVEKELFG